jgi:hypothetical protein
MGTPFNDANAWLDGGGNLSLGTRGQNDEAGHPDYPYAKNDVSLGVSPLMLVCSTQPQLSFTPDGLPIRTLAAGSSNQLVIPLPQQFQRGLSQAPHGVLVKGLHVYYRVQGIDLDASPDLHIYQVSLAEGEALPVPAEVSAVTLGAKPDAGEAVADAYAEVMNPEWVPGTGAQVYGTAVIDTTGGATCDLLGASWDVALALY